MLLRMEIRQRKSQAGLPILILLIYLNDDVVKA